MKKLLYLYSKLILRLQYPAIRDSEIDKTAKVGYRSNVVRIEMGKYSYLGNNNSLMDVKIGNYCSIASYCSIGGGSHPMDWVSTSPHFYNYETESKLSKNNAFKPGNIVNIGNDVWVGEASFIKDGITIGNGAIIGAHSVVTKNVPPYAIVAGNPAKILKYRFDELTIEKLLDSEWWNMDDEKLNQFSNSFNNPKIFLERYSEIFE